MIKKSILAEIERRFPGFDYEKFKLLAFIAFVGEVPSSWALGQMFKSPAKVQESLAQLESEGYIRSNAISPSRYFDVAFAMLELCPDLEEGYSKKNQFRYSSYKWLWKMAKAIYNSDRKTMRSLKRPADFRVDLSLFLDDRMGDGRFEPLFGMLKDDEANAQVLRILRARMGSDTISSEWIRSLLDYVDGKNWLTDETYEAIGAYHYFSQGAYPEDWVPSFHPTWWSMAVDAIRALHSSNISDAFTRFKEAIIEKNRVSFAKGSFEDTVVDWFYAECLARAATHPSTLGSLLFRTAEEEFSTSSRLRFSESAFAPRILNTYRTQQEKKTSEHVSAELMKRLTASSSRLDRSMAYLLLRYFRCSYSKETVDALSLGQAPSAAIIRHELSTYLPLPAEEKEALNTLFGSKPILEFIPRKEDWEVLLGSFGREIESSRTAEKRIIYFINGGWITHFREQERGSDGQWKGAGRALSRQDFVAGRSKCMNDADIRLAYAIAHKQIDIPDATVLFPIMHGSDRIFTGEAYPPLTPATVMVEKPYIEFTSSADRINISSNVRLAAGSVPTDHVEQTASGEYLMISPNDMERKILEKFLPVGSLPLSAGPMLRQSIQAMEGLIDCRYDIREEDPRLILEGDSRLAVRVTPDKNRYKIVVQAAPLHDGEQRFSPGEGETTVFDSADGVTYHVQRDLVQEYANYQLVHGYITGDLCSEFSSYQETEIEGAESLLGLMNLVHDHPDSFFMEWPEGQILKFKGKAGGVIDVQVKTEENWFGIESSIEVDGKKRRLDEILKMYGDSDIRGYLKIGENEYARMTGKLQRFIDQMTQMGGNVKKGRISVPVCQVGTLATILGEDGGLHAEFDDAFKGLLSRMEKAYRNTPSVPSGLQAELRPYQMEGFRWMTRLSEWGAGACLADDMGLGKTVQSTAFMLKKAQEGPSLVVAPKSVIPNWEAELARFAPSLSVRVLNDESRRDDCVESAGPGDVLLVTYGVLVTESELLSRKQWNVACLDEAHQIKNRSTRMAKAAMSLSATYRLALTGTPVQNHLGELWSLFQFINPGLLGTYTHFSANYMKTEPDENARETLRGLTQPFILRRTKDEVLADLPDKTNIDRMVILSKAEKLEYEKIREMAEVRFKKNKTKEERKMIRDNRIDVNFFAELTRLRLMANHPGLVLPQWQGDSSKVDALMDILSTLLANDENNVIVFSQFTSLLEIIGQKLEKEGTKYLYLDGQTPAKKRQKAVEDFQAGRCRLFLVSLKAGGLGLNLTRANHVILMDPWWNPAIEQQATDRAHRIGQEREVTVTRLIAQGTIEEKILHLHETKKEISDKVLEGTGESYQLTMDDVLDMVSPFR